MKKRVLAVIMCSVLSLSLFTACGSDKATTAAATEEAADDVEEEEEEAEEDVEEDGMCSDESFSALQEAYAYLTEEYNLVEDYYMSNEDIPQDDDVEDTLAAAKDYLDQMGEVEQSTITEDDAVELAQSMQDVAEGLQTLAEGLGIMAEAGAASSDDMCSDESFAALQEAYAYLTEEYNLVEDYYMSNDDVAQDDDVEDALSSAKDYLEQMGEVEQSTITEDDAVALAQSMMDVATALETLANAFVQ